MISRFARYSIIATLLSIATLCHTAMAQEATGSLTLSTEVNGDGTLTPTLTWSTTPAGATCAASGDDAWSGSKPGSGSETLAPFPTTTPKGYALMCSWPDRSVALLSWTPPTQNTDGSTLTNLAGFRIAYGRAANALTQTVQLNSAGVSSFTIENLADGVWFFAVRAFTSVGTESALSNITSKTIAKTALQWSQTTGVKVPAAPVLGDVE